MTNFVDVGHALRNIELDYLRNTRFSVWINSLLADKSGSFTEHGRNGVGTMVVDELSARGAHQHVPLSIWNSAVIVVVSDPGEGILSWMPGEMSPNN